MVKQGDIIEINFNPQSGHEQAGYRPAVVVSNDFFNIKTNLTLVCPITNTDRPFPLHVPLDDRTITTGVILCEHVKALDIKARDYKVIEQIPVDLLEEIIAILFSEIQIMP
ncbi:MAG: type II toxin-antitoxin system PemK/MazF family toxin [Syntrophomonadaceae bacterium]|jgi:mRNA interferase MazF|nr:type II toxin-antitoxin system PemK/MazF family toxin [Syntrophomonadaceae bacterium]